jgi:drug/metabolite transporter (DMT)-like permease
MVELIEIAPPAAVEGGKTPMNRSTVGLILLIIGVLLLLVGGISFTTQERTKLGPISIEHPEEHHLPYSPLAGALLAVTGGALMLTGRAKSS